jgi:hypothetical protein
MNFLKKLKKEVFVCGKWYFGHQGQTVTSRSMKTTVRSKLGEDRSIDTMQVKIGRVCSEEIVDKHPDKQTKFSVLLSRILSRKKPTLEKNTTHSFPILFN